MNKENVLIVALSTLNSPAMYMYRGVGDYIGIAQQEAGTKNVLYMLAEKGEKLKRIIILESHRTRNDNPTGIEETYWNHSKLMEKESDSAVTFYKQRIWDYLTRDYSSRVLTNSDKVIENFKEFETPFPEKVSYSEEELKTLFVDIKMHTNENLKESVYQEESMPLFMEIIRRIKGNTGSSINLYVDTQGGSRSTMLQINAVMELLKDQNVKIAGRYAIPGFNYKDQKAIYMVQEVSDSYRAYELVSSMTEFKQYGRGKGLSSFFADANSNITKEIVDVIQKISGAIAICNITEFENGLKTIMKIRDRIQQGEPIDSQIRIVFEDIVDNYSTLLNDDRSQFDIVKWCTEKLYYQQAITIIESRMPEMLMECGCFYYNLKEKVRKIPGNKDKSVYSGDVTLEQLIAKSKRDEWKHTENYLFEQWVYSNERIPDKKNKPKEVMYFGEYVILSGNLLNTWRKISSKLNTCYRLRCSINESGKWYNFEYTPYDKAVSSNSTENKIFRMFATLSKLLKLARNEINHGNSNMTENQIKDALETYVAIGEELKLNEKWKNRKQKEGRRKNVC